MLNRSTKLYLQWARQRRNPTLARHTVNLAHSATPSSRRSRHLSPMPTITTGCCCWRQTAAVPAACAELVPLRTPACWRGWAAPPAGSHATHTAEHTGITTCIVSTTTQCCEVWVSERPWCVCHMAPITQPVHSSPVQKRAAGSAERTDQPARRCVPLLPAAPHPGLLTQPRAATWKKGAANSMQQAQHRHTAHSPTQRIMLG